MSTRWLEARTNNALMSSRMVSVGAPALSSTLAIAGGVAFNPNTEPSFGTPRPPSDSTAISSLPTVRRSARGCTATGCCASAVEAATNTQAEIVTIDARMHSM